VESEVGIEPTTYRLQGQRSGDLWLSTRGYAAPMIGGCVPRATGGV